MRLAGPKKGFTLTEILMAVGILGVGMTMVASVYPVAVDQSRRSADLTQAALCARSVAAMMRARRSEIKTTLGLADWLRRNAMTASTTSAPGSVEVTNLPEAFRKYDPYHFAYEYYPPDDDDPTVGSPEAAGEKKDLMQYYPGLYYDNLTRKANKQPAIDQGYLLWSSGSFVPVVFATPMHPAHGPWRIAIVIYKSRGGYKWMVADTRIHDRPECLSKYTFDSLGRQTTTLNQAYLKNWTYGTPPNTPCRGKAGDYVLDGLVTPTTGAKIFGRGEAYLVENFLPGTTATSDNIALATGFTADRNTAAAAIRCLDLRPPLTSTPKTDVTTVRSIPWISLPGALMAYHTIIGD